MRLFISALLFISLVTFACHPKGKSGAKPKTFTCLTAKIDEFSKQSCETGANVKEYKFQGKHVYVFEPGSCGADMTAEVVDSDCKNLGNLGGISGNTKINGEDFSKAEAVKTIWEK